jgi:serine/threonine protein kinase
MYSDLGYIKLKYLTYENEITRYTPPEVLDSNDIDFAKADIYSLGVILWELLHPGKAFEITWNRTHAYVEFDDYPDSLRELILRILSKRGDLRPSICDIILGINEVVYESFGDILCLIRNDLTHMFTGQTLLSVLVTKEIVIDNTEGLRVCQTLLNNMLIRVVRQKDDLFSVHFDVDELEFSVDNEYTTTPMSLESNGSRWSERDSDFIMTVSPRARANSIEF